MADIEFTTSGHKINWFADSEESKLRRFERLQRADGIPVWAVCSTGNSARFQYDLTASSFELSEAEKEKLGKLVGHAVSESLESKKHELENQVDWNIYSETGIVEGLKPASARQLSFDFYKEFIEDKELSEEKLFKVQRSDELEINGEE